MFLPSLVATALASGIVYAEHLGQLDGDHVRWTSTYQLEPDTQCITVSGPSGEQLLCGPTGGQIIRDSARSTDLVDVPLAISGPQRVRVKHGAVVPNSLVTSPAGYTTRGMSSYQRRSLDAQIDGPLRAPPGHALYIDPAKLPPKGLSGEVVVRAAPVRRGGLGVGFFIALAVLATGYNQLRTRPHWRELEA